VWEAVAADWRTAPVSDQLRATLGFLEKQTFRPEELRSDDADAVYATGVSHEALRTASTVCGLFNMIVRLADSFGWDVPPPERLAMRAPAMLEGGYVMGAIRSR
jgi:alkylhydroperoxidase family enzyme